MHLKGIYILIFFGCNVRKISFNSNFSIASFMISLALLSACLEDPFIDVNGVFKSPTIIVFSSISPFMSISIYFRYFSPTIVGAYVLKSAIFSS